MANNSAVVFSLLFSIVKYYKIQVKFEIGDNQQNFDQVMALYMVGWLVLLLYVPSQQLWSLRDGQFT